MLNLILRKKVKKKINKVLCSIVLKLSLARRADLVMEPSLVDEKIGKVMTRCDPADPAGKPG